MIGPISEKHALVRLTRLTDDLRLSVVNDYERRAKSCMTCETPGACCLDAHFVNVHISRLEAVRIGRSLDELPVERREQVGERVISTINQYDLTAEGDTFSQKFACPLFERGIGCLVHDGGKPVPCIMHACYEDPAHLPPSELQFDAELAIDKLNTRTYSRPQPLLPIPLALKRWLRFAFA